MSSNIREIGIFSWYGFYQAMAERLQDIKSAGFDGVMLWWEDEYGDYPVPRSTMPQLVADAGLKIHNIHLATDKPNDFWSDSKAVRKKEVGRIKQQIYEVAELGVPLVCHLCEGEDLPSPPKELLYSFEELLGHCEDLKAVLALENTWDNRYLDVVFSELSCDSLGFCYDTSHGHLRNHLDFLSKWQHLQVTTHISDNDGEFDRHWLPFDGEIDFEELYQYYDDTSFPITMEVIADLNKYNDPQEFLFTAYERANKLQEKLLAMD